MSHTETFAYLGWCGRGRGETRGGVHFYACDRAPPDFAVCGLIYNLMIRDGKIRPSERVVVFVIPRAGAVTPVCVEHTDDRLPEPIPTEELGRVLLRLLALERPSGSLLTVRAQFFRGRMTEPTAIEFGSASPSCLPQAAGRPVLAPAECVVTSEPFRAAAN